MSYMQFRQRCDDCQKQWNAAFGIVGTTMIAEPPRECPHCGSVNIKHVANGWLMNDGRELVNGDILPRQE